MDIRTQLLKGNSRANADTVATYVGGDPGRFRILIQCMLDDDRRTGQLASHSVAIVCDTHPGLAVPYLGRLLGTLDAPVHEAVQRNSIRIMQTCTLPKGLHGRITSVMFALIADAQRSIAQRAFAITVAARMVQAHPGLADELRMVLEDALRTDPGPAIRSRAGKVLKVLRGTTRGRLRKS